MKLALARLNADPATRRRMLFARIAFVIYTGSEVIRLAISDGRIEEAAAGADEAFAVHVRPEAWSLFTSEMPPPGYQDIAAMTETGSAEVTGSVVDYARYLPVIRDAMAQIGRGSFH